MGQLKLVSLVSIAALFGGCASHVGRGVIAMPINDREAHVCVGKNEVEIGEKVSVIKNRCGPLTPGLRNRAGRQTPCSREKIGTGVITEKLNEHYAVVNFDKPIRTQKGDEVELN